MCARAFATLHEEGGEGLGVNTVGRGAMSNGYWAHAFLIPNTGHKKYVGSKYVAKMRRLKWMYQKNPKLHNTTPQFLPKIPQPKNGNKKKTPRAYHTCEKKPQTLQKKVQTLPPPKFLTKTTFFTKKPKTLPKPPKTLPGGGLSFEKKTCKWGVLGGGAQ